VVKEFKIPPNVPQPGSTDQIDSLDGRLTQAVAAADPGASGAEAVWTQQTIAGGAGTARQSSPRSGGSQRRRAVIERAGSSESRAPNPVKPSQIRLQ
jgi:hypothetical protein